MAEIFEPQSPCAWERRKKYHHGNPHHAVFFSSYPLHFALLLLGPFSPSYSYHLNLFSPSFPSSTEPRRASSHLVFSSTSVTSPSTILSRSSSRSGVAIRLKKYLSFLGKSMTPTLLMRTLYYPPPISSPPPPSHQPSQILTSHMFSL